jgi:hypothetical protein
VCHDDDEYRDSAHGSGGPECVVVAVGTAAVVEKGKGRASKTGDDIE